MGLPPLIPGGSSPFGSARGQAGSDCRDRRRRARSGSDEQKKPMTKAEERAAKALARSRERERGGAARSTAHRGVSENPLRELERREDGRRRGKLKRGTSVARVKRGGDEEEEEDLELQEKAERDRRAIQASLGIAPPLPQSILKPTKGIIKKR